mgnify:CR=1 FL=1|jgi:hypothetical protein|tara:strand:+ start:2602 stop:2907 length:306 start_codon:yes stop_codon:yes gene_type:complete
MKFEKSTCSELEVLQYQLNISISRNKQIELSFIYTKKEWSWFEFLINWTRRRDNAGLDVYLEILMLAFRGAITDKRLWSYDEDRWEEKPKYEQASIKYEWF